MLALLLACTSSPPPAPIARSGVEATFADDGVHLAEGASVRLAAWGRADLAPLAPTAPVRGARRVEYRHDGLTEWWVSQPDAVWQGFAVARAPAGTGPLTFDIALRGATGLHVDENTGSFLADGRPWQVNHIAAWDADGAPLPARLSARAGGLRLAVDDASARYPVMVDPLYATPLLSVTGADGDQLGAAVTGRGDFDGDGYDDVAIGAPGTTTGSVYVYHGASTGLSTTPTLTLTGEATDDGFGSALEGRCDYDHDGYADLAVQAPDYDGDDDDAGRVYVYWGSASGLAATTTTTITGSQGNEHRGTRLSCGPDIDGDGYDELLVGSPHWDDKDCSGCTGSGGSDAGRVHVHYGGADRFEDDRVTTLEYERPGDCDYHSFRYGVALAGLGDVDGDGYGDVGIGEPGICNTWGGSGEDVGWFFVYAGSADGLHDHWMLKLHGHGDNEELGRSTADGNFDGDGYFDVAYGTPNDHDPDRGAAWVRLGSADGLSDGSVAEVDGENSQDSFAEVMAGVGDVDGDGYDDLLVGATEYGSDDRGKVYLYTGAATGLTESSISTIEGTNTYDAMGAALAGAGDVDGNGLREVIVGAPGTGHSEEDIDGNVETGAQAGAAYVYRGYADTDDVDSDGVSTELDCDDTDATVGGWRTWYADEDGDGFGDPDGHLTIACDDLSDTASNADDCDDTDAGINPGEVEICDDADVDEDCDGDSDDADPDVDLTLATAWYEDDDGDGYGLADSVVYACSMPSGYAEDSGDCDDTDDTVNPVAQEVCDAADTDEDCDGLADDDDDAYGSSYWSIDADGDGYGQYEDYVVRCESPGTGWVNNNTDCDDTDASGATTTNWYIDFDGDGFGGIGIIAWSCGQPDDFFGYEFVSNNWDCDDNYSTIGTPSWYYPDSDGDSYGDPAGGLQSCDSSVSGYVVTGGTIPEDEEDCDDTDADLHPGAAEECDGVDNDCDGLTDDDDADVQGSNWFVDADGDGHGSSGGVAVACDAPTGYVGDTNDCDDGNPARYLGAAEVCDAANTDEDCDGLADDNDADNDIDTSSQTAFYVDDDGDGYGAGTGTLSCDGLSGWVTNDLDCDNADPDSAIVSVWHPDADGDGYGNGSIWVYACVQPEGYVADNQDCDDTDSTILTERPLYLDGDGDGYGDSEAWYPTCEAAISGFVENDWDCDDTDPNGALASTWHPDADGDGYGNGSLSVYDCTLPDGYVADNQDCDDTDASSGGRTTFYLDDDADGYGEPVAMGTSCTRSIEGFATTGDDCDDGNAAIHPGAAEVCDPSDTDEDCDGLSDDEDDDTDPAGLVAYYPDADGDTWGDTSGALLCDLPSGWTDVPGDCADTDDTIHPEATEACNGVDDNCDGTTDEGCPACSISLGAPAVDADLTNGAAFQWEGTCDGYRVEVSPDPTFPTWNTWVYGSFAATGGTEVYQVAAVTWATVGAHMTDGGYWRVVGAVDGVPAESETRAFTSALTPATPYAEPPDGCTARLISPADDAAFSRPPTFSWSGSCGFETNAWLEVSADPTFPLESTWYIGVERAHHLTMSVQVWASLKPQYAAGGYWRVTVGAADGDYSSVTRSFLLVP